MCISLRIAVADDEPIVREYFRQILPLFGHEVVCAAENGRELADQCRSLRPDLVITDINMPVLDGLEAAIAINRERVTPVIVLTGYHSSELIARAGQANVTSYLRKPIKQNDLKSAIDEATRGKSNGASPQPIDTSASRLASIARRP